MDLRQLSNINLPKPPDIEKHYKVMAWLKENAPEYVMEVHTELIDTVVEITNVCNVIADVLEECKEHMKTETDEVIN